MHDPPTPEWIEEKALFWRRARKKKTVNSTSQAHITRSNLHTPSMDAGTKSTHLNALLVLLQVVGPSRWG